MAQTTNLLHTGTICEIRCGFEECGVIDERFHGYVTQYLLQSFSNVENTFQQQNPDKESKDLSAEAASQDPKAIKAENEQLKEQTLCKVCLDNTVCIVFLPCGHLVTCADCAPAMRKCPICRALVKGTVRTYMS